jgi:hypothetical protein
MLVLTDRDLKALLSLSSNWRRQYLAEVARLIGEDSDGMRQSDLMLSQDADGRRSPRGGRIRVFPGGRAATRAKASRRGDP